MADVTFSIRAKDQTRAATRSATSGFAGLASKITSVGSILPLAIGAGAAKVVSDFAKHVYDLGASWDAARDSIQSATGATGMALDALVQNASNVAQAVETPFHEVAEVIGEVNTAAGLTGDELEVVAEAASDFGTTLKVDASESAKGLLRVLNQFGNKEYVQAFDAIALATQKTGTSADVLIGHLQRFGPVLQGVGLDFHEATGFISGFERIGVSITEISPAINQYLRRLAKEGVQDVEYAFIRAAHQIANATTEVEAINIATSNFGSEGGTRLGVSLFNNNELLKEITGAIGSMAFELSIADGVVEAMAAEQTTLGGILGDLNDILRDRLGPEIDHFIELVKEVAQVSVVTLIPAIDKVLGAFEFYVKAWDRIVEVASLGTKDLIDDAVFVREEVTDNFRQLAETSIAQISGLVDDYDERFEVIRNVSDISDVTESLKVEIDKQITDLIEATLREGTLTKEKYEIIERIREQAYKDAELAAKLHYDNILDLTTVGLNATLKVHGDYEEKTIRGFGRIVESSINAYEAAVRIHNQTAFFVPGVDSIEGFTTEEIAEQLAPFFGHTTDDEQLTVTGRTYASERTRLQTAIEALLPFVGTNVGGGLNRAGLERQRLQAQLAALDTAQFEGLTLQQYDYQERFRSERLAEEERLAAQQAQNEANLRRLAQDEERNRIRLQDRDRIDRERQEAEAEREAERQRRASPAYRRNERFGTAFNAAHQRILDLTSIGLTSGDRYTDATSYLSRLTAAFEGGLTLTAFNIQEEVRRERLREEARMAATEQATAPVARAPGTPSEGTTGNTYYITVEGGVIDLTGLFARINEGLVDGTIRVPQGVID